MDDQGRDAHWPDLQADHEAGGGASLKGTRKGSFEDDGLPDEIVEATDNHAFMDIAQLLDDGWDDRENE